MARLKGVQVFQGLGVLFTRHGEIECEIDGQISAAEAVKPDLWSLQGLSWSPALVTYGTGFNFYFSMFW